MLCDIKCVGRVTLVAIVQVGFFVLFLFFVYFVHEELSETKQD